MLMHIKKLLLALAAAGTLAIAPIDAGAVRADDGHYGRHGWRNRGGYGSRYRGNRAWRNGFRGYYSPFYGGLCSRRLYRPYVYQPYVYQPFVYQQYGYGYPYGANYGGNPWSVTMPSVGVQVW